MRKDSTEYSNIIYCPGEILTQIRLRRPADAPFAVANGSQSGRERVINLFQSRFLFEEKHLVHQERPTGVVPPRKKKTADAQENFSEASTWRWYAFSSSGLHAIITSGAVKRHGGQRQPAEHPRRRK